MPSVAELEAMRDALIAMRAAGVRVSYVEGFGRVEYQTDADLARALADIEARIARASPTRPHTIAFSARKGV
jgi:hypothetical protein